MGSKQSKTIEDSTLNSVTTGTKYISSDPNQALSDARKSFANSKSESTSTTSGCPMKSQEGTFGSNLFKGECPHKKKKDATLNTVKTDEENNSPSSDKSCPVKSTTNQSQIEYNVYSQPINPTNNMPTVANQLPSPMQKQILSSERVKSSIPKGGASEGSSWVYPSPQMFYNSLVRKNKLGDTDESDMESVVSLHNNMNEKTWAKVIEWEDVLNPSGTNNGGSKLLKFIGRPSDLSPKARIKNIIFSHPIPFDRHDWTVVRPDGHEVRYVIDYYYDESNASDDEGSGMPDLHDRDAVKSILVDVRPALDSVSGLYGRILKMPYARRFDKSTKFEPLPMIPSNVLKNQLSESEKVWSKIQSDVAEKKQDRGIESKKMILNAKDLDITESEAKKIAEDFASMLQKCKDYQAVVDSCDSKEECKFASIGLTKCMASIICPTQHNAMTDVLNSIDPNIEKLEDNTRFDTVLHSMSMCVQGQSERAKVAKKLHPDMFRD